MRVEDSDLSDNFKKENVTLEVFEKNTNLWFFEIEFWKFSDIFKKFLSRLPVSFFGAFFWLGPQLATIPSTITHRCFRGKCLGEKKIFSKSK